MSDDERACCVLCICCACGSTAQREFLTGIIKKAYPALSHERATAAAHRVLEEHDSFRRVRQIIEQVSAGAS